MLRGKSGPVVRTTAGPVRGRLRRKRTIALHAGIPYAAPPVGNLRWRAPQPPTPWTETLTCTKPGPMGAPACSRHGRDHPVARQRSRALEVAPEGTPHRNQGDAEEGERGLPHAQRASTCRRKRPAGDGVDPRRRPHRRVRRRPDLPLERRAAGAEAVCSSRSTTGSAVRVPRPSRPVVGITQAACRATTACSTRSPRCVGAGQHRGLRRRPRPGHHLRRIGRWRGGAQPDDGTVGAGTVPPCDRAEPERPGALAPSPSSRYSTSNQRRRAGARFADEAVGAGDGQLARLRDDARRRADGALPRPPGPRSILLPGRRRTRAAGGADVGVLPSGPVRVCRC